MISTRQEGLASLAAMCRPLITPLGHVRPHIPGQPRRLQPSAWGGSSGAGQPLQSATSAASGGYLSRVAKHVAKPAVVCGPWRSITDNAYRSTCDDGPPRTLA